MDFANRRSIRDSSWGQECCKSKVDLIEYPIMGVVKLEKNVQQSKH